MKFVWLLSFVAALILLAGCGRQRMHNSAPNASDADAGFLYDLLDHHMHWDKVIDPCAEKKTIRAELQNLCSSMEADRTAEVATMTKMYSDWFGKAPTPVDSFPDWVGTLEGSEFERNFLKSMNSQYDEGVDLSAKCAERANRGALKQLCTRMRDEQRAERKKVRDLACTWFNECA